MLVQALGGIFGIIILLALILIFIFSRRDLFESTGTNIYDITGIENDQCVNHHTDDFLPTDVDCNITFSNPKLIYNILRHNNKKICLNACLYHYTERIEILYGIIKYIVDFLDQYNVEWCMYYGGLVGLYTRQELLPWDSDLDILIGLNEISKLPNKVETDEYYFDINKPSIRNENIIGRFKCKKSGLYCDITYYKQEKDMILVKKMKTLKDLRAFMKIPQDKFYPLQEKSYKNGIIVPVPNDILYNLENRYGKLYDHYIKHGSKYILNIQG